MTLSPLPDSKRARDRSLTVSILAWLGIIGGAVACLGFLAVFFAPAFSPSLGQVLGPPVTLVAGIGLRNRRNWARLGYIAVSILSVVTFAWRLVLPDPNVNVVAALAVAVLINGAIVAKLMSRGVRAEFAEEDE